MTTIYLELFNEGTDCWRPVEATFLGGDVYCITSPNPDPNEEQWAFNSGDKVRCSTKVFSDGDSELVAFEKID
jgi:hypothetical protein